MMQPSDVTEGMVAQLHERYDIAGRIGTPTHIAAQIALAAALTAMPDDLLRKLVAERGCVMVDEARIKRMVGAFLGWSLPENFSPDAGISFEPRHSVGTPHEGRYRPSGTNLLDAEQAEAMIRAMLAASDPRQRALDRMAEDAQELGLYAKEKGDE
ncbi:MAG: hypothetical protein KGL39_59340 [Patescibacteria group bacterium]|nr:hypothetical protein [Patescibacteria group bacterium]